MNNFLYKQGLIAGFVATAVLSVLMVIKGMMGIFPALNPIHDIVNVLNLFLSGPYSMLAGWIGHFVVGTVIWGLFYAALESKLSGSVIHKGVVFGIIAWIAMMVVFMPFAEQGMFGLRAGLMAPVATFVMHMVYGIVLASVFAKLPD